MTTTADRPRTPGESLRAETDLAEIDREYSEAAEQLVEESRAEARAAGRQFRVIHRMWRLQEEAHEQRWTVRARWLNERARRLGRHVPEPEKRTLLDVADEIGPALQLPAPTAVRRVEDAVLLAESLPRVLEALEEGAIRVRQAEVILDLWRDLVVGDFGRPHEEWTSVEAVRRIAEELLQKAPSKTAAQLRALARRRRAGLLRATEEARHRIAHRDRTVWVEPREDGMAQLCAFLDAATAHAVYDRLQSMVGCVDPECPPPDMPELAGLGQGTWDGGPRTAGQLRADILAALLLDGEPAGMPEHLRGIRGQVTVTVPVLALLERSGRTPGGGFPGLGELPRTSRCAELAGYGPIPLSMAERIAAAAPSWSRILTHPVTGTVLDHDRTTYAVPADLKRRLRHRDGTCRFPGCRRRAERCDLDHTVAWAEGGTTAAGNLAHLCRHHHLLKHRDGPLGRWRVRHRDPQHQEGVLEWTSPAGRTHLTYPQEHGDAELPPAPSDALPLGELPADRPLPPDGLPSPDDLVPCDAQSFDTQPSDALLPDDPPPF